MTELAGLTEESRKLALDRFHQLQPHLEQNHSLRSVAQAAGIPYRTAQRWIALYRMFGLAALARKHRSDRGERRAVYGSSSRKFFAHGIVIIGVSCALFYGTGRTPSIRYLELKRGEAKCPNEK